MTDVRRASILDLSLASFEPGFKGWVILDALDLLSTRIEIPALVVVGERPGPTMMAVASVHGNEYEGQEAVREVFGQLEPSWLQGTYCGMPVCNPFAYESRSRSTPPHLDGLNLARVFPGDERGSPTQRLAHGLMEFVLRNLGREDLFVDFHSASEDSNYLPLVGLRDNASAGRHASEAAARHFGNCQLWLIDDRAGMFNAEVSRAGIPSIGTEITGQAGCRAEDVAIFSAGLMNLLRFKGMIPGPTPVRDDAPLRQGIPVSATATGFLRLRCRLGDHVTAGEPLGDVITILGVRLAESHAPVTGQVWMRRTTPAVRVNETICIIGVPVTSDGVMTDTASSHGSRTAQISLYPDHTHAPAR